MTGLTVITKLTPMNIVIAMAADAILSQFYVRRCHDCITMAAMAVEPCMCTIKREVGLQVMIKPPRQPVDRHMAKRTFLAKSAFVDVILEMAVDTLFSRVQKRM